MSATLTNTTLLETLRQGLLVSMRNETMANLGNRNEYAGLTDLAKYYECPRNAQRQGFWAIYQSA